MREPVRELAVVREQERAGRVRVQPSDRQHARFVLHEIDDDRPPMWISRGRDHPGRLVQEHVRERLGDEELPVEVDDVALLDERVQPSRDTVHTDAAPLDQLVCTPPGSDPGAGEVRVQAHRESFTLGANRSPMRGSFLGTLTAGGGWYFFPTRVGMWASPP